ncbi:MAG: hypothetical protein ACJAS4_003840 [Bacteriovoracaceae bacterium]
MSKLSFLLLLFFVGCASNNPVKDSKLKKVVDEKLLKMSCVKNRDALSCAKLAYHYQSKGNDVLAYRYYEKGCRLKNESSCYNMKSSNPKAIYFKKVDAVMNFHSKNITNCHLKTRKTKKVYSSTQLKEKWHKVNISIHIDSAGKADSISVSSALPSEFKSCAVSEIKKIQFPKPISVDPTYTFNLTIQSQE